MDDEPEAPYKADWYENPAKSVCPSQIDSMPEDSIMIGGISDDEDLPHNRTLAHTSLKRMRIEGPK